MPLSLPYNMEPYYSYHYHTCFQSGISLCCSGTKPDAYGFRWRFYEGPPIDCENENFYTCLSVLSITQQAFHLQCLLLFIRIDLRRLCIPHKLLMLNDIAVFSWSLPGDNIQGRQMSIDQLQTMQVIRGKRTNLGGEDGPHQGLFHAAPGRPRKADKVRG